MFNTKWRWETASVREMPQCLRRYGDKQKTFKPRDSKHNGNAKIRKKLQKNPVNLAGRGRSGRPRKVVK